MSRARGAPLQRQAAYSNKQRDSSSKIAALFVSRPDESILSAELLAGLYSADCSAEEVEERVYRTLLPLIKQQVAFFKEHPHLESSDDFRITCAICPNQTLFRGWSSLHIHAQKYWKRFPHQHQGYSKALKEVLQAEKIGSLAAAATTDALTWPPVLLVDNGGGCTTFDGSLRRWKGLQGMDVPFTLHDMELEEVLAIFKKRKGDDRDVVVFPASEIGLIDIDKLTAVLDTYPALSDCLKVKVSKEGVHDQRHKYGCADYENDANRRANQSDEASTVQASFNYEKHRPLGTWATLKEIRETGLVDSIMGKWAKGFELGNESFSAYKWPFQKSKKLRDLDIKFQESLRKYHACGAVGNEKLRVQLDEIENQLQKERLLWLKEIRGVREQFEGLKRDIKNEEAQKALDKHIWTMKLKKENDGERDEEAEQHFSQRLKMGRAHHKKRQQHRQDMERNRELLLRQWRYEKNNFRKQAVLAKEERDCINSSLEQEEMLDSISRILEGCGCCHKGDDSEECESNPCCKEAGEHGRP